MTKDRHIYTNLIMAGFGGQGLMFIGKLLAVSAMKAGFEVSWIPSYGPEMRGGTAHCTVVVSDKPIVSPIISSPEALIIMNNPSLEKFEHKLQAGGILIINSNLVTRAVERQDIDVISLPADDIARAAGDSKVANMVMLGAYLARTGLVNLEEIENGFKELFQAKAAKLDLAMRACKEGLNFALVDENCSVGAWHGAARAGPAP